MKIVIFIINFDIMTMCRESSSRATDPKRRQHLTENRFAWMLLILSDIFPVFLRTHLKTYRKKALLAPTVSWENVCCILSRFLQEKRPHISNNRVERMMKMFLFIFSGSEISSTFNLIFPCFIFWACTMKLVTNSERVQIYCQYLIDRVFQSSNFSHCFSLSLELINSM